MKFHFRDSQWDDACELVEKHHYSKRVPANVQFVGSLHEPGGLFGDCGEIVAACFFSIPPTRWSEPVLELSRLVRAEQKVPLSSLISQSARVLKKRGERLLVSFADRTQGHFGGVYQSASWLYAGCRERRMDGVIWKGEFVPGRSANSRWGTQSPTRLSTMGIQVSPHYDEGKHIYFRHLCVAGKSSAKRLGLLSKPYPANRPQDELATSQREAGATPAVRSRLTSPEHPKQEAWDV